jgi:predicted permease
MVINHLFPVFALVLAGAVLKRLGVASEEFLKTADRLIYFFFFPAMLFWKIGGSNQAFSGDSFRFYLAVMSAVGLVYLLSILAITLFKVPAFKAGGFSQGCYRFNTYIGMAVILNALGEAKVAQFGVLIGMAIPVINVLAVSTLIWFSGERAAFRKRVIMSIKAVFSNPLILACAAGLVYAHWFDSFPLLVENTLRLGASVSLPLALISIGGSLSMKELKDHLPLAATAALIKGAILPAIGYAMLIRFNVAAHDIPMGMIFFALPTSTAIYVLCAQLNSDTAYASTAIMVSTLFSIVSLSAVLWWFHG